MTAPSNPICHRFNRFALLSLSQYGLHYTTVEIRLPSGKLNSITTFTGQLVIQPPSKAPSIILDIFPQQPYNASHLRV